MLPVDFERWPVAVSACTESGPHHAEGVVFVVNLAVEVVFVVVEAELVAMREVELVPLELEFARGTLFVGVSFDKDFVGEDEGGHGSSTLVAPKLVRTLLVFLAGS